MPISSAHNSRGPGDLMVLSFQIFNSVPELVTHGYSPDMPKAAKAAFLAGSDMEMESRLYERHLMDQVRSGEVPEELIDDAVRRVLRIKFRLGLFENPYKYCEAEGIEVMGDAHLQEARELARQSMVLLKNEAAALPSSKRCIHRRYRESCPEQGCALG